MSILLKSVIFPIAYKMTFHKLDSTGKHISILTGNSRMLASCGAYVFRNPKNLHILITYHKIWLVRFRVGELFLHFCIIGNGASGLWTTLSGRPEPRVGHNSTASRNPYTMQRIPGVDTNPYIMHRSFTKTNVINYPYMILWHTKTW